MGSMTVETSHISRTPIMKTYFNVIAELNRYRVRDEPFPLANTFYDVHKTPELLSREGGDQLFESWEAVSGILDELSEEQGKKTIIKENFYQGHDDVDKVLLTNTKRYLEKRYARLFKEYQLERPNPLTTKYRKKLTSMLHFIKLYLKTQEREDLSIFANCDRDHKGYPIWAVIFYLLRSGETKDIIEYASSVDSLKTFANQFQQLQNTTSSSYSSLLQYLKNEYQSIRDKGKDIYQKCVYNIISKYDPDNRFDEILQDIEDYIWYNLNFLLPSENYTKGFKLADLQRTISELGADHFHGGDLEFFRILMLTQQFEEAILFLESTDTFKVEAFHFAIVFYYYGVLRLPNKSQDIKRKDIASASIDFIRMLKSYVKTMTSTKDIFVATNYIYLIQNSATRKASFRDLIIETKAFDELLGYRLTDETKQQGLLIEFVSLNEWNDIVRMTATLFEEKGDLDQAQVLFDLCDNADKVLDIMIKRLSLVVSKPNEPDRLSVLSGANQLEAKYKNRYMEPNGVQLVSSPLGSPSYRTSDLKIKRWDSKFKVFGILLRLAAFFDAYRSELFQVALNIINELQILPTNLASLDDRVLNFHNMNDGIRRNIADILIAAVECCARLYQQIISEQPSQGYEQSNNEYINSLKTQVTTLVNFAGMIQYRMSKEVHIKLAKIEMSMMM